MIAALICHVADERLFRAICVVEANEVCDVFETLRHAVVKKVKEPLLNLEWVGLAGQGRA